MDLKNQFGIIEDINSWLEMC